MIITGVIDGTVPSGPGFVPNAIEFYVQRDIENAALFGFATANDGSGSMGFPEFIFPPLSYVVGTCIYVTQSPLGFADYFGFDPDFTSPDTDINGNDAVELYFQLDTVVDVFGVVNQDGSGASWDYTDGWAYRVGGTGPDGDEFVVSNWRYSGVGAIDGDTDNTGENPWPIGTYDPDEETTPAPVPAPAPTAASTLILTGVVSGLLFVDPVEGTAGIVRAIELYVIEETDLSRYGLSASVAVDGSDPEPFVFPNDVVDEGEFIYVALEALGFEDFFGSAPNYTSPDLFFNGDEAILLFLDGAIVDVYGRVTEDGTDQIWEYTGGWAYRKQGTGPDGTIFMEDNWLFSGVNALVGEQTNDGAATPFHPFQLGRMTSHLSCQVPHPLLYLS